MDWLGLIFLVGGWFVGLYGLSADRNGPCWWGLALACVGAGLLALHPFLPPFLPPLLQAALVMVRAL